MVYTVPIKLCLVNNKLRWIFQCAAGRAAWQEAAALSVGGGGAGAGGAARRCSVLGDHPGARLDRKGKWIRNNRVRTTTTWGSGVRSTVLSR